MKILMRKGWGKVIECLKCRSELSILASDLKLNTQEIQCFYFIRCPVCFKNNIVDEVPKEVKMLIDEHS